MQWFADWFAGVANVLSGAYKMIKGMLDNFWLSTLTTAGGWIVEGIVTTFTGGGSQAFTTAFSAATDGV